jgi:D-arabinose 1-dehydrogenase-like Zn-dependent alcohol dehydrogenase
VIKTQEIGMDVRAALAVAAGKPLEVTTVQLEGPKAGEVLVEIKATGICHTDEFTLSGPHRTCRSKTNENESSSRVGSR